ncbi:hypothetical protein SDC9_100566 [bioreactor metagenome]|uniref:Uncharacterized protein n=1 Tax=bioreactor metagenome TaxID=1076179 RepID=A0A645AL90_9ZZZZ
MLRREHIALRRRRPFAIRQPLRLGDEVDDVHAKSIHAAVKPAVHHSIDFRTDGGVFPVEVRLLLGKQMQVPLIGQIIIFPRGRGKERSPVVGFLAVFSVPPDVIVAIGIVLALSGFDKPGVLVGTMVDHEIHNQPHPARMQPIQQRVKLRHRAKLLHDGFIITDVIPHVVVGGIIDRVEPNRADAERSDIV